MNTLYMQIGTLLTRLTATAGTIILTVVMGGLSILVFAMVAPVRAAGMMKGLRHIKSDWHDQQEEKDLESRDQQEPVLEQTNRPSSQDTFQLSHLLSRTGKVSLAKAIVALTAKATLLVLLTTMVCTGQVNRSHSAIGISEDNDWFTGTDKYYTNGIRINYVYEPKRFTCIDALLLTPKVYDSRLRGVGIVQTMYTPSDISKKDFIADDHPYAGTLYIQNFEETLRSDKKIKVYSELDLGVIGPYAFAGETQTWFHTLIHDEVPKGWDHQVESSVIINYTAFIEKGLLSSDHAEVIGHAGADFGSTMTDINAGIVIRAGLIDNYFKSRFHQDGKFHAYAFFKSGFMLMMQDQTLQGKLEGSQYAITADEVNHKLWRVEYGMAVMRKWFTLSYSTVTLSQEFIWSDIHQYGNISMAFTLR